MGSKFRPGYADAKGVIIEDFQGYALLASGTTAPTDGTAGYAPGCKYFVRGVAGNVSEYKNDGTAAACDFNQISDFGPLSILATTAGAGITGGVGTIYKTRVEKIGSMYITSIYIDLTGLGSSTTDLDIIGVSTPAAHIGQITAARNGTIDAIRMTCLELPAGGVTDIDLYSANEATGVFDGAIASLVETALITAGGAWASGTVKGSTGVPPANDYLYLTCGAGGVPGTYTAGKFLIELIGY